MRVVIDLQSKIRRVPLAPYHRAGLTGRQSRRELAEHSGRSLSALDGPGEPTRCLAAPVSQRDHVIHEEPELFIF